MSIHRPTLALIFSRCFCENVSCFLTLSLSINLLARSHTHSLTTLIHSLTALRHAPTAAAAATICAQGDGSDGTMFLSPNYMVASNFVIPMNFKWFSIVCRTPGTASIQSTWGASATTVTMGGTPNVGAYYYSDYAPNTGFAGTVIQTTVPCYVVFDSLADDEIVLLPSLSG